jgi:hypothetical protein
VTINTFGNEIAWEIFISVYFPFIFKKDNAIVGAAPESNQTSIKSASRFLWFPN